MPLQILKIVRNESKSTLRLENEKNKMKQKLLNGAFKPDFR